MKIDKIILSGDHASVDLKENLKNFLTQQNFNVIDLGTNSKDSVDYPDFAHALAEQICENVYGVVICGTGIGVSIVANRHENVRCALCHDTATAALARQHNNANVLALGARNTTTADAIEMLKVFFSTEFEGGRHERRVSKINLGAK
ncbi:MAG: ribose 5-phosphate isomerase B [Campylobacter sp.]|nr:ribose 5-phosphate isomerase B [Campylobacter sp.]